MQKSALRAAARSIQSTTSDNTAASAQLCQRLSTLPELAAVSTVLGYAATAAELSVDAVLHALLLRGVAVCLPWVDDQALGVGRILDLDADLGPGWRGLREPLPGRRTPLRPSALDAVLVPGVAFDLAGNRLGHGGGHFDRLLARVRRDTVLIGVARDEQIIQAVPVEPHDRRVHLVVTPTATLRASS